MYKSESYQEITHNFRILTKYVSKQGFNLKSPGCKANTSNMS